jgi:hypothetical protein
VVEMRLLAACPPCRRLMRVLQSRDAADQDLRRAAELLRQAESGELSGAGEGLTSRRSWEPEPARYCRGLCLQTWGAEVRSIGALTRRLAAPVGTAPGG